MPMKTIVDAMMSVNEFRESEIIEILSKESPITIFPPKRIAFPMIPIQIAIFSDLLSTLLPIRGTIDCDVWRVNAIPL